MNLANLDLWAEWVLQGLWRATWQASVLAMLVLILQAALARQIGGRGRYLLWSVVILRLILPLLPQSPVSIFNLSSLWPAPMPVDPIVLSGPSLQQTDPVIIAASSVSTVEPLPADPVEPWTWPQLGVVAWLIGIAVVLLRMVIASRAWRRSLGRVEVVDDPHILALVSASAGSLSLRRCPGILAGQHVRTPAVVGLIRPYLLLPARVLESCSPDELRLIVLHELAHIKRHDLAANWLLAAATALHWFNPFVWLLAARIRADRELACDETVLAHGLSTDPRAYGQTLLRLIEILSPTPADRHPQLVGILEPSAPLQRRMRMIATYTPQNSRRWVWIGLVLIGLGCTALTDSVKGQAPPEANAQASDPPAAPVGRRARSNEQKPADVREQLERVLPEVRFEAIGFGEVIDFLRDVSGTNIAVNWRALDSAGIDRAALVTARLRNVTFEQALTHILRDVGGGAVMLDYSVEGNVLSITTAADAASRTRTAFYDVSDLLLSADGTPLTAADLDTRVNALKAVITQTLARESWRDHGGNGAIEFFNGKLVITQTPKVHQQIENMLIRLREKPTTQPRPLAISN